MIKTQYERLTDLLKNSSKKTVYTKDIQNSLKMKDYTDFYGLIFSVLEKGLISPVKSSGTNGMQPILYKRYRINRDNLINTESFKRELLTLHPRLNITYYQKHPETFQKDKTIVLIYDAFFREDIIPEKIERRELSFLLFSEEKWLESSTHPYKVLKRLGLDLERDFNCFDRRQPFTWFPFSFPIKNILIVENLTPFSDCFLILKEQNKKRPFDAIVFGSGRHINASFSFFYDLFESIDTLRLFYWGDIDAAGLNIYFSLKTKFPDFNLQLWKKGYVEMIKKHQVKTDKSGILLKEYIPEDVECELIDQLREIMKKGQIIPQEALNYSEIEELLCT